MKIYNQEKTQGLNREELNFDIGYLKADKLFVAHHDATPFVKGRAAAEIANEKRAEGVEIIEQDGNFYAVDKTYESGGKSVSKIKAEEDMLAKEAYDEYEDIQVFVPYTAEELETRKKERLRAQRVGLLAAFDKWEKAVLRGRESDDLAVMEWYRRLLDLDELAFESVPTRIQYYIG